MSAKQKIVQGGGPSNINLGIFASSFNVCRASKQFPSINYGQAFYPVERNGLDAVLSLQLFCTLRCMLWNDKGLQVLPMIKN